MPEQPFSPGNQSPEPNHHLLEKSLIIAGSIVASYVALRVGVEVMNVDSFPTAPVATATGGAGGFVVGNIFYGK